MATIHLTNGTTRDVPLLTSAAIGYVANAITIGAKDVSQLRVMLNRNPATLDTLLAQLEARFPENRLPIGGVAPQPVNVIRLSSFQTDVLQHLFEDEKRELYSSLNSIAINLQCEKNRVRLACRALKRKGLAKQVPFHDDEGFIRGSGYGITPAGIAYGEARGWKGADE
ncbi:MULTISPECIES: hypothetical protein [unclassified Agrobacterium]